MKKQNLISGIIYGICAVIWTTKSILDIIYQTHHDSVLGYVLNILCAMVWMAAFLLSMKRYRSTKKK